MRPLVLISSLATGGAERVTLSFLRCLAAHSRPVPLCTVSSRRDELVTGGDPGAGIVRYGLGARRLADPLALFRLVRLVRRRRINLLHAHGQDASILAALARGFAPLRLVITRHVLEEPCNGWRQRARAGLTLAALRRADAVIAVSTAAAHQLSSLAHIPLQEIRVIRNGIDLPRFNAPDLSARAAAIRQTLGVTDRTALVLVPAVLREGKGHEVLLNAWGAVRAQFPDARLAVAGAGEREAALREQAHSHGKSVIFLGMCDTMEALLAASDLVVLPSLAEALPTVLMEAAAVGRPVVATRVGGIPEIVEHGRTGILVPPLRPDALARAILALLLDPERAQEVGAAARVLAREQFSVQTQVRRTLEFWEQVGGSQSQVATGDPSRLGVKLCG